MDIWEERKASQAEARMAKAQNHEMTQSMERQRQTAATAEATTGTLAEIKQMLRAGKGAGAH